MKLTVFTAIFGDYDVLNEPLFVSSNIKYICFTDREYKSKNWDVRVVPIVESTPRREARKHKILSHKYVDADISLWIDGSRYVYKDPFPYIKRLLRKSDIITGIHPSRNCLYDEAVKCINTNKGNPTNIMKQVAKYHKEGYPRDNGLINSTIMLRRMTPVVIKVENDWWDELNNFSVRDQISFNYILWKNKMEYRTINWRNFIGTRPHKRRLVAQEKRRGRRKR